ncbi:trypsin-like serine protease [Photobacterium leiognathi]|uniref:trypsin-like serine protease n=1 Tax=Photobacterium leiognathi TaxID=553611 RepID=UPI0034E5D138
MCNGDSGGPLIYTDQSGQKIQVGVSSYSSKDCGDDSPEEYIQELEHFLIGSTTSFLKKHLHFQRQFLMKMNQRVKIIPIMAQKVVVAAVAPLDLV